MKSGRDARTSNAGEAHESEEKVTLVGFPFRPPVPSEAHFLGVVGAKFIAKELTVRCSPRLQLSIYNRQMFSAKSAAGRSVLFIEDFSHLHLSSLTPRSITPSSLSCNTRVLHR
jgi:hypothetical protein